MLKNRLDILVAIFFKSRLFRKYQSMNSHKLKKLYDYSLKRKRNDDTDDDSNSDEDETPQPSSRPSKLLSSLFGKGAFNHIYFYDDVELETCLELTKKIRATEKRIKEMQLKCDLGEDFTPKIYLHISSFGGSIFAGFSVIDAILQSKVPVVTILEGGSASSAILISLAGHERWMGEYAYMLIHQLSSGHWGKMADIEDDFENLQELMRRIKQHITRFSNGKCTGKELDEILKHNIWWTAKDALQYGLIDKIITGDSDTIGNSLNVSRRLRSSSSKKSKK